MWKEGEESHDGVAELRKADTSAEGQGPLKRTRFEDDDEPAAASSSVPSLARPVAVSGQAAAGQDGPVLPTDASDDATLDYDVPSSPAPTVSYDSDIPDYFTMRAENEVCYGELFDEDEKHEDMQEDIYHHLRDLDDHNAE